MFANNHSPVDTSEHTIEPIDKEIIHNYSSLNEETKHNWSFEGAKQIIKGKLGLLVLAGGMGSRLGSNDPKGMYDIGLPSHKSLFQIICEKFMRAQAYSAEIWQRVGMNCAPRFNWMLYIMTHDLNDATTKDFFISNNYFGVPENRIMFFKQASLPPLTFDGKIMLESKTKLALCPNGNGALFEAIRSNKAFQENLKSNKIDYIHIVGVDNALNKFIDPLQVGLAYSKNLKGCAKFLQKAYPTEPMGVFVVNNGKTDVIEYSELGEEMANQKNDDGTIKYRKTLWRVPFVYFHLWN